MIQGPNWIDWNFTGETISEDSLNTIFDKLNINKVLPLKKNGQPQTQADLYDGNTVCIKDFPHCKVFYLLEKRVFQQKKLKQIKYYKKIYRVSPNNLDDADEQKASDVYKDFVKRFEEKFNVKFNVAFKPASRDDAPLFKKCIPAPLNYGDMTTNMFQHVYKIDISSAYAYELSKTLPTAEGMKEYEGIVAPNGNYPFAYYPKERKLEVYGENIKSGLKTAEKTILMKASKYSLKPLLEDIYALKASAKTKEERQHYKNLLNYTVGYFQRNNNPVHAYITAVVIARCDERVGRISNYIEDKGGNVILINTDAIAWDGLDMPELYTSEKKLGNFMLEHYNCKAYVKGAKCYQLLDNDGTLTTIYAGMPKEYSQEFKFGEIFEHGEIEVYAWDDDKIRFIPQTLDEFYRLRSVKNNA